MTPIIDVTSTAFRADPYPTYARMRAEAPVCRVTLPDKQTVWFVTRYDDVITVLKDARFVNDGGKVQTPEQAARAPWMPSVFKPLMRNMLNTDELDHTRLRGLVHKAFTPRLVEAMQERIRTLTEDLLDRVQARGRMDLIRDYALPIPATIIAEMLGVPVEDQHRFQRWSNALVSSAPSRWGVLKMVPPMWAFLRYIRKLVKTRRAEPREDLVSALVQARESGDRLSEDELLSMIFLLLVAGYETTVNLIGNGVLALMEHPEQMERLRDEPGLIKTAVEELLRYDAPVQIAGERYPREDVTIAGVTIARGEMIQPVLGSANRDDWQFDRPDELDLAREPNRHVAFGQGVHYCLGAPLARLEGQLAINALLRRLPELRLDVPRESLRHRAGLGLRGLGSLPVAFSRRRATVVQTARSASVAAWIVRPMSSSECAVDTKAASNWLQGR
jgi:cytochrome P450